MNNPILTANGGTYNNGNVGDDTPGVPRLRRVWDSWSTEYSVAPPSGLNVTTGFLTGPPYGPPIYPSYPAPYQAPLQGNPDSGPGGGSVESAGEVGDDQAGFY